MARAIWGQFTRRRGVAPKIKAAREFSLVAADKFARAFRADAETVLRCRRIPVNNRNEHQGGLRDTSDHLADRPRRLPPGSAPGTSSIYTHAPALSPNAEDEETQTMRAFVLTLTAGMTCALMLACGGATNENTTTDHQHQDDHDDHQYHHHHGDPRDRYDHREHGRQDRRARV